MIYKKTLAILMAVILISSCKKEDEDVTPTPQPNAGPKLIVKLSTNPNQERLGNTGQPTSIPAGNAGQNPTFNKISAHYFELAPSASRLLAQDKCCIMLQKPQLAELLLLTLVKVKL